MASKLMPVFICRFCNGIRIDAMCLYKYGGDTVSSKKVLKATRRRCKGQGNVIRDAAAT